MKPILALCILVICCPLARADGATVERGQRELLVFAAVSLTEVLGELAGRWQRTSGLQVRSSFAASSVLARQIEAGVDADAFVAADLEWMDYLQERNLIEDATRRNLAGNRLVLVAPAASEVRLAIAPGFALAAALGDGRLATGDPEGVPAGRYARAALTTLGVWEQVRHRLAPADNVRSALLFVVRGEAPLGIVYATDAVVERRVRIVGTFPAGTHAPITYPAAALRGARPEARAYLEFLASPAARATWKKFGFVAPDGAPIPRESR
jgi:molybdate transport system substrate-binding protein